MVGQGLTSGEIDERTLARARSGDAAAFTDLVRHYDHRLRALAYRLLGDRTAMDDVLQDAYVKAFRSLPSFRGGSAVGTWLYRIAYTCCIDELRRRQRRPEPVADDWLGAVASDDSPERRLTERDALASALAALPDDQRAAVLLVDGDGFSYDDAAAVLGVAPGTVASRLSRARAALRRALTDEEDG